MVVVAVLVSLQDVNTKANVLLPLLLPLPRAQVVLVLSSRTHSALILIANECESARRFWFRSRSTLLNYLCNSKLVESVLCSAYRIQVRTNCSAH